MPRSELPRIEPLLVDVLVAGRLVYAPPPLDRIRALRDADLAQLDSGVRRLINPHTYHVSLSERLWRLKADLTGAARSKGGAARA